MTTTAEKIAELQERIKVMEHFENGGSIESKNIAANNWVMTQFPSWRWRAYGYRIKPQPLEGWVNVYKDFESGYRLYDTARAATDAGDPIATRTAVHMVEKTDES